MNENQRNLLKRNRMKLLDCIHNVEEIQGFLQAKNVLTDSMVGEVRREGDQRSKVRKLLDIIPFRGEKAFWEFIEALEKSDNNYAAAMLRNREIHYGQYNIAIQPKSFERKVSQPEAEEEERNVLPSGREGRKIPDFRGKTHLEPKVSSVNAAQYTWSGDEEEENQEKNTCTFCGDPLKKETEDWICDLDINKCNSFKPKNPVASHSKKGIYMIVNNDADWDTMFMDFFFKYLDGMKRVVYRNNLDESIKKIKVGPEECIAVVIISNGKHGEVYLKEGENRRIHIKDIIKKFDIFPDNPKLFFIQACCGQVGSKERLEVDRIENPIIQEGEFETMGPERACRKNVFVAYATRDDFVYEETQASKFLCGLFYVLQHHLFDHDIFQLIEDVNQLLRKDDKSQDDYVQVFATMDRNNPFYFIDK